MLAWLCLGMLMYLLIDLRLFCCFLDCGLCGLWLLFAFWFCEVLVECFGVVRIVG